MAHWAKVNDDNMVETVIVTSNDETDEGESWIAENLEGTWIKTSYNTKKGKHLFGGEPLRMNFAQPGALYIVEQDAFTNAKKEGEEDFILHEPTLSWVPAPVPQDATYALPYGPEPDCVDGVPQISETDNVYTWISGKKSGWWLNPNANYPRPEGECYWSGFDKEWQIPDSEKPADNYFWDVLKKQWVQVPEVPTESTK